MYYKSNSIRGGNNKSRSSYSGGGRSFGGGGYGKSSYSSERSSYSSGGSSRGRYRGFSRGPRRSQLGSDPNVFIKKADVSAGGVTEYKAQHTFADFPLATPLRANIMNKGYSEPTPIQDQAITPILEGKDLIGLAKTGTGKTAAFLIPTINRIFNDRQVKALIIAPTRELAVQINDEFKSFAAGMGLYSTLVIGGTDLRRQIMNIRRNPHVVIGTPGRLKDLVMHKNLNLDDFSVIVLDEVDLMVDIGFINDIKYFISMLPEVRQSLFFSATISPKINEILSQFVRNPVQVSVKSQDSIQNIEQDVIRVISPDKKIDQLHDLLISDGFDKVLIFGRTKHGIEKLHKELDFRGFKVGAIHSNKKQNQRQRTLASFKQNEIQILLATDIASRGIDIDNVTHVINYELPETYEDYIHRIGRTGRANRTGTALTFIG